MGIDPSRPGLADPMTLASFLLNLVDTTLLVAALGSIALWFWLLGLRTKGVPLVKWGPTPLGPTTATMLMAVAAWLLILIAVPALILAGSNRSPTDVSFAEQIALSTATNAALLLALPAVLRVFGDRSSPKPADVVSPATRIAQGLITCLIVAPVVYGLYGAARLAWSPTKHPLEAMLRARPDAGVAALTFVSSVLFAPAAEELIFRRYLLSWLAGPRDPASPDTRHELAANVVVSIAFAAVHQAQWPTPLALFPLSLVIGWLYLRTGSLAAAIGLHAGFNAIGTLQLYHSILS